MHQLNVKTTSDNIISDTEYGATSSTKNRTRRTTRNIRFPNQMIEQLTLEATLELRSGISQPGSLKPAVGDNVQKREHIHQLKVMKNEHPAILPSEQDDIVNSLNYEGIAVIELRFYHFFYDSDRLRVGSVTD